MNEGRPADWDEPVELPSVDLDFRTIVVPFDGSHAAERALAGAGELAPRSGAEVVVVVAILETAQNEAADRIARHAEVPVVLVG